LQASRLRLARARRRLKTRQNSFFLLLQRNRTERLRLNALRTAYAGETAVRDERPSAQADYFRRCTTEEAPGRAADLRRATRLPAAAPEADARNGTRRSRCSARRASMERSARARSASGTGNTRDRESEAARMACRTRADDAARLRNRDRACRPR